MLVLSSPVNASDQQVTSTPPQIAIIIPTRDRWDILRRTLDGLTRQTVKDYEVIVAVDGRDQDVPALPGALVVMCDRRGPSVARNAAAGVTKAPVLLFLGDDMIPDPGLVRAHLAAHEAHPEREAAVLGRYRWHPEVAANRYNRWLEWSGTTSEYQSFEHQVMEDVGPGRFYSSNVSIKRDLFLAVGGFDEAFFFLYEDIDIGLRLAKLGMKLLFQPDAMALHLHEYNWESVCRRMEQAARSEKLMTIKHAGFQPFFYNRVLSAMSGRREPDYWPDVADRLPDWSGALQGLARRHADRWYYQRLASRFIDAWEDEHDLEELRLYLGDNYREGLLWNHSQEVDREARAFASPNGFYRNSQMYLYDLTVFAMSGTKRPYLDALQALVPHGARVLDYGCGIGSDGLRLLERGYLVEFADFENPSTDFLKWRLQNRGLDAPVWNIDDRVPEGFEAAYSFDVIEHVDDPLAFLGELERRAAIVVVNLLEPRDGETQLHRALPIDALIEHAQRHDLLLHELFHGRSHLLAYRSR
ncbi:MAG: glycosyltransferase [Candidatus Dormibacteraeota bacterium]|nr:glycosyltransferase [Candidatus Dormibacteraeota bacterium]